MRRYISQVTGGYLENFINKVEKSWIDHKTQALTGNDRIRSEVEKIFDIVESKKKIVWQHNRTSYSRAFKRGEWVKILKHRPDIVVLSPDALTNTPRYIPYSQRVIIPHAVEDLFIRDVMLETPPSKPIAFFASRPSRNLQFVIDVWQKYIHPLIPHAEFHVCFPPTAKIPLSAEALAESNIILRGSISKDKLVDLISKSRALLYPGHVSETGCQVALQAIGMGVPIVTSGIGCLKD